MRLARLFAVLIGLMPLPVLADPVLVSISALVPEGGTARPVSWSAVPLDLPEGADVLEAMRMTPEPVEGPWIVALEPGEYVISGFTEVELYERKVEVSADKTLIEVPVLAIEETVVLRCAEAFCDFADDRTGLRARVPQGWAVDAPYFADLGNGEVAQDISAVFFEDLTGDGGAVWFLNPVDWITGDTGPCRAVAQGNLCTFDLSPAAEAAFAVIAPSLQRVAASAP